MAAAVIAYRVPSGLNCTLINHSELLTVWPNFLLLATDCLRLSSQAVAMTNAPHSRVSPRSDASVAFKLLPCGLSKSLSLPWTHCLLLAKKTAKWQ
jgi:hypothetical protein